MKLHIGKMVYARIMALFSRVLTIRWQISEHSSIFVNVWMEQFNVRPLHPLLFGIMIPGINIPLLG